MMVPMRSVNNKSIGVRDLKASKCVCEVSVFIEKCKKLCCCALFLQFGFLFFILKIFTDMSRTRQVSSVFTSIVKLCFLCNCMSQL